jgi:serine/threonine protein kinase
MEAITHHAKYGSYEVKLNDTGKPEILGQGRYGVTLRARQEGSPQDFAVKILKGEGASSSRALREICALRDIRHQNLVNYVDAETSSDGESFIVMELCEGGSLAAFSEKHGPLPESTVARISQQVARGLAETHARGYLHCDLKPSNLLLGKPVASVKTLEVDLKTSPDLVKLGDFGLASELSQEGPDSPTKFRGTALFASPEQFQEKPLDVRTDLYSLGMTMWYLLCGGPPLTADNGSRKIDIKSLSRFHTDAGSHLDHAGMKSLHLSAPFRTLLGKLLAKDKDERFANASEVEAALEKCLLQMPKETGPSIVQGTMKDRTGYNPPAASGKLTAQSTLPSDWGKGRIADYCRLEPGLSGSPHQIITAPGTDRKSNKTLLFTFWQAAESPADASEKDLGKYLAALRRYSLDQEKGAGDSLLPVVSVRRTRTEWCVAEPLVKGIPLAAFFGVKCPAPLEEAEKVLGPLAETIDRMVAAGLDRGQVSIDSVYLVAASDHDYFAQGRCLDEPMRNWPEWKICFSGLSMPLTSHSGNHKKSETTDIATATASFDATATSPKAYSHNDETVELSPNPRAGLQAVDLSCVVRKEGIPDQDMFSSFCRLVFRLLSGHDAPVAASWAPGAFVPTGRLTVTSNDLLRDHLSGHAATCSATRLISTILENETQALSRHVEPQALSGYGTEESKNRGTEELNPPGNSSVPQYLNTSILRFGLALSVIALLLALLGQQLFREWTGKTSLTQFRSTIPPLAATPLKPADFENSKPDVPLSSSRAAAAVATIPMVAPPAEEKKIVQAEKVTSPPEPDLSKIPSDDPELNLLAAHSPLASFEQKLTFLQNAARAFSGRGEKTRARNSYLELADLAAATSQSQRARFLAEADQIASLGFEEWTEIQDHAGPGELRDKYRDKVLAFLAVTSPETAFTRLMEYAGQAASPEEKSRYYARATALSSLPKPQLRLAYEKIAESGGFAEKLQLYDFLLSVTLFHQDATKIGREIVFSGVTGTHLADRTRVSRDLWERFHDPEALKWLAENLAEGTDRQKARWDYYTETQKPEYADAARFLAEDKQLSSMNRGRYAWLYFNTLPAESRKKANDAGKFLDQAIAAGISEAVMYRQQVQQVEESRIAAESVKEAASQFMLAASRIDRLIEKVGAQKIEKDGQLDVAAYQQKIASLHSLLEETRQSPGAASLEPQQGNIHWWSFTTWETAVGLKARNSPFSSRSPGSINITPEAMENLTSAVNLGNLDAKARLASILAGTNPVKPRSINLEKAAQLAGEVCKSGKSGQTEARLVLRHLLNTSTKSRQTTTAVLKSLDIDPSQILGESGSR